jgi:hypothetical protein
MRFAKTPAALLKKPQKVHDLSMILTDPVDYLEAALGSSNTLYDVDYDYTQ